MYSKFNNCKTIVYSIIIPIYANNIKKNIKKNIHGPYSVMLDGTQDISGQEQEVICIRYLDDKFNANKVLIGKLNSIN